MILEGKKKNKCSALANLISDERIQSEHFKCLSSHLHIGQWKLFAGCCISQLLVSAITGIFRTGWNRVRYRIWVPLRNVPVIILRYPLKYRGILYEIPTKCSWRKELILVWSRPAVWIKQTIWSDSPAIYQVTILSQIIFDVFFSRKKLIL